VSLVMFDSVDLSQIPADATALGCYVDGRFANSAEAADRFPHARILTIAVFAAHDADALDIEQGDATPGQAVGWYARQRARGVARPCLYASAFVMDTEVIPAIRAAGIGRQAVRLWSAHYTDSPHICGPASCKELGIDADGTQFTDRALGGRNLDQSLLADDFFDAAPAAGWQEALMNKLPILSEGAADRPGRVYFVRRMQALTKAVGEIKGLNLAACQEMSGTFDAATKAALQQVQASWKVAADGTCGPVTWSILITGSAP